MLSIAFTGDIAFSGKFKEAWKSDFVDSKIIQFLNEADYVVANVECPITDQTISSDRVLNHVSSPDVVSRLIELNANVWNLSNNHILDCGEKGVLDTIELAHQHGCMTVGVGEHLEKESPLLILGQEEKVGVISISAPFQHLKNINRLLTWNQEEIIKKRISELRKSVKWIVIVAHGGEEFSSMPMPWTRKQYLKFLDWGADVVVAHHPHVVQNYELVGDKIIFYSLGNFIFDTDNQRNYRYTENGVLLKLYFSNDGMNWDYMTTQVEREEQKVIVGKSLPIFINISGCNYRFLWPVAAKQFVKNDDFKKRNFFPQYIKMSDMEWKIHKIKRWRYKRDLILQIGCVLCSFKIGCFSKLNDVCNYLSDK